MNFSSDTRKYPYSVSRTEVLNKNILTVHFNKILIIKYQLITNKIALLFHCTLMILKWRHSNGACGSEVLIVSQFLSAVRPLKKWIASEYILNQKVDGLNLP